LGDGEGESSAGLVVLLHCGCVTAGSIAAARVVMLVAAVALVGGWAGGRI
jgi:hypothetical protein